MICQSLIEPSSAVALLARVQDDSGVLILPANVSAISVVITDMMADTVTTPISVNPSGSIYSTLQVAGWTADAIGYNVAIRLDGSNFPTARTTFQVVVTVVPASSLNASTFTIVWQLQTDDVL